MLHRGGDILRIIPLISGKHPDPDTRTCGTTGRSSTGAGSSGIEWEKKTSFRRHRVSSSSKKYHGYIRKKNSAPRAICTDDPRMIWRRSLFLRVDRLNCSKSRQDNGITTRKLCNFYPIHRFQS